LARQSRRCCRRRQSNQEQLEHAPASACPPAPRQVPHSSVVVNCSLTPQTAGGAWLQRICVLSVELRREDKGRRGEERRGTANRTQQDRRSGVGVTVLFLSCPLRTHCSLLFLCSSHVRRRVARHCRRPPTGRTQLSAFHELRSARSRGACR
jgi:hypothetical protein